MDDERVLGTEPLAEHLTSSDAYSIIYPAALLILTAGVDHGFQREAVQIAMQHGG
jgi:hypothetical protein